MNGNADNGNYRENSVIEKELKKRDRGHHQAHLQ
jgi:hypothetical protein